MFISVVITSVVVASIVVASVVVTSVTLKGSVVLPSISVVVSFRSNSSVVVGSMVVILKPVG